MFISAFLSAENTEGGKRNLEYTFTFRTGHIIPKNGALIIEFPDIFVDLGSMNIECSLGNFILDDPKNASYCRHSAGQKIDIILKDTDLNSDLEYKVVVSGITNPNVEAAGA